MFKKITAFLLLFLLIGATTNNSSDAFFFGKKKKQPVEKVQKKEEKKVLVVQIYASWCPGCKNIQPTLDQLVKEVSDINFVQLDVSTPSKAQASAKLAKELKVDDFFAANKSKTATVAIVTPTTHEIISVFENDNDVENYKKAIEKAKTQEKSLENPPA